ncbi:major capsid protein P2 [Shewanella maritima]|uniref:major capsid protein P2 n=1 Tax=Shewanella maritima TaxID=2520507 RepID=UPI0037369C58
MRQTKLLPSFANVAKGNTTTLELPLGMTYDKIHLSYSGVTLAQLKEIKVDVNGKTIQHFKDGDELQSRNKNLGLNVAAGTLDFHFKDDVMKTLEEARMFGLGTANADGHPVVQNVTISIDIDGAATAPVLSAHAIQSNAAPIGVINKVKRFPYALNAGVNEIDNIPTNPNARIARFTIKTDADIEKIELEVDSRKMYEMPKILGQKVQVDHGRAPQTGYYYVDLVLEGDMLQALTLVGVQDLRLRLHAKDDTTASTACVVIVDYFDGLPGL